MSDEEEEKKNNKKKGSITRTVQDGSLLLADERALGRRLVLVAALNVALLALLRLPAGTLGRLLRLADLGVLLQHDHLLLGRLGLGLLVLVRRPGALRGWGRGERRSVRAAERRAEGLGPRW